VKGMAPASGTGRARPWLKCYRRLERANPQVVTALICFLILLVLEAWNRPYFFGDDNMRFTFVHMSEIARNLVHGESIFRHHHVFGGGFDMRDDPAFLCLWHPLSLLCSLLTLTRWKYMAVDVFVAVCLVTAGAVMARLLVLLRQQWHLRLSNTLLIFLSAGYACSGYSIVLGAAWGSFTANVAALPMLLIGVLHPQLGRGALWVAFAGLLGLFAGHVDPLCYSYAFVFLLAASISWQHRSFRPLLILALGILATILVSGPILWQTWCGFATNPRAAGLSTREASDYAVPSLQLLAGYFVGLPAGLILDPVRIFGWPKDVCFLFSMSFSSLLLFAALRRCTKWSFHSLLFLVLLLFAILLAQRPPFLARAMLYVPVLKSLKWPFRQLLFFHFFITLWMASNLGRLSLRHGWKFMSAGVLIFGVSLGLMGQPAFSDYGDRRLILSGAADHFWARMKQEMPPDAVLVTVNSFGRMGWWRYPLSLTGGANLSALYGVTTAGGYSFTKPCNTAKTSIPCDRVFGFFKTIDLPALQRTYKSIYLIEVLSPSSIRMGICNSDYETFVSTARIVDYAASYGPGRELKNLLSP
jgi:hypothetical protein